MQCCCWLSVIGCIYDQSNIFIGCLLLVVLMINPTFFMVVVIIIFFVLMISLSGSIQCCLGCSMLVVIQRCCWMWLSIVGCIDD
jgi:hypothetical protein